MKLYGGIDLHSNNSVLLDLLGELAAREVVQRTAALGGRTFTDPAAAALFAD